MVNLDFDESVSAVNHLTDVEMCLAHIFVLKDASSRRVKVHCLHEHLMVDDWQVCSVGPHLIFAPHKRNQIAILVSVL